MALKEYCAEQKLLQKSKYRSTGRFNITKIILRTALNNIDLQSFKKFADENRIFRENGGEFSKRVENIVGKR